MPHGEGHAFTSRCDTEILPHLYERYGADFAAHIDGDFGVAVWDSRNRRLVLARDPLGVKSLYYSHVGDLVVFASELRSILASGLVEPTLDYEAIDVYLTFGFFVGEQTPLRGVSKLLPGCRLTVDDAGPRTEQYWRYPEPQPAPITADEAAHGLLGVLEESVRARLMSDVPIGAMLSGGLDSSLIVALMARNSTKPVKTFSIGFAGDATGNELADARLVASTFGTEHHELEVSLNAGVVELDELVWHLDLPISDLSAPGFYALSQLASSHVTVALSGQGADELLGGYRKHQAAAVVGAWQRMPSVMRRIGSTVALGAPDRFRRPAEALAADGPAERLLAMSGRVGSDTRSALYRGPLAQLDGGAPMRAVTAIADGIPDHPLLSTLYIDAQLALPDAMLHYFDQMSMAHSLEVRVPFLDRRVVEFCAKLPAHLKVRRLNTKFVLKHAARGLVPDRIVRKPKVGFFRGATDAWLREQIAGPTAAYLLDESARYTEFLDRDVVRDLVVAQARGQSSDRHLLKAILMLEVWLRSYIPRAIVGAGSLLIGALAA